MAKQKQKPSTEGEGTTRRYPRGHCQECGEPLRFEPCLNCIELDRLREEDL